MWYSNNNSNSNRASTSDIITSTYLFELSFSLDSIPTQPLPSSSSTDTTISSIPFLVFWNTQHEKSQFVQYVSRFTHNEIEYLQHIPTINRHLILYIWSTLRFYNKRKAVNFHWINMWNSIFVTVLRLCYIFQIRFYLCGCAYVFCFVFIRKFNIVVLNWSRSKETKKNPVGIIAKRLTRLLSCAHVAIVRSFIFFLLVAFSTRVVYDSMFSSPAKVKIFCLPFFL